MQTQLIPVAYCQCGCGELSLLIKKNNTQAGLVRGEFYAYRRGYHQRGAYKPILPRLEERTRLTLDGCWEWTGARSRAGYGRLSYRGSMQLAHRVTYELLIGPIPDGLQIDHLCRNRACVNPVHLEPVTSGENTRRGLHGALVTHCPQGHEYTPENTYHHATSGSRVCRTCKRIRARVARERATEERGH